MFFSKPGEYEPCGLFSVGHFILLVLSLSIVGIALYNTKNISKEKVKEIIKKSTIVLWILEIIKIIFNFAIGNWVNPNNYIPLYYCSIILYAGLLSGWGKGVLKKVGDVFISTGAIIGGLFFLFCPNTSLPAYPMFHFISLQSFIFHGTMLYLGILVNITNYIDLRLSDIKYYASLITGISFISYIVNEKLGTNFMFISKNFPNTPVEIIYNLTGKFFSFVMILIQVIGPFYVVYFVKYLIKKIKSKIKSLKETKVNLDKMPWREWLELGKDVLIRFLKHALPGKLEGNIAFGTGNPEYTGYITGIAAVFYPKYGEHFSLYPDFERKMFEAKCRGRGRIRLGYMLVLAVSILKEKSVRTMIKNIILG